MKSKPISITDILGISSATLCLVHCLVFPVITFFSMSFSHAGWINTSFATISFLLFLKVLMGQTQKYIKWILGFSIALVIAGVVLELVFNRESVISVLGGFGMIIGHALNYRSHSHKC
jgi:hypothetical protein